MAALMVLLFHAFHSFWGQWRADAGGAGLGWLAEGHSGVTLFFVLSGYLFMQIAMAHDGAMDYRGFLRNRCLRVVPLFVVVFVVAISIGRDAFRPQDVLYLLFSNLGDAPTSKQFMTGAAWTVSVEFMFYLVFPFLARFSLQSGPSYLLRLIALLLLLKAGAYLASDRPTHMLYSTLLGRMDQFLLGMLMAQLGRHHLRGQLHGGWTVAAVAVMWGLLEAQARHASFFLPVTAQPAWIVWPTLEAAGWGLVILCYTHSRHTPWRWADRLLSRGGEISYSLYLWHGTVIYVLSQALETAQWMPRTAWEAALAVAGVLVASWWVATLSYRSIEAPFLALRGRYTPGKYSTTTPP